MDPKDARNLNPHKAARIAMLIWGDAYSKQRGGSMDFWDKLSEHNKQVCRDALAQIEASPNE